VILRNTSGSASNWPVTRLRQHMADEISAAAGRPVRHEQTPVESTGNPDMYAMWRFLNGPGYQVDIEDLHKANPDIGWTSFADWAHRTFQPSNPAVRLNG
jgi:hypothetical protein